MRHASEIARLGRKCVVWAILILTTPIAIVFRLCGVRFLGTGIEHRFGHQVAEPYFAALLRRTRPRDYRLLVVTYDSRKVANEAILKALPEYFLRIDSAVLRHLLKPFQRHPICRVDMEAGLRTVTGEALMFKLLAEQTCPRSFFRHQTWYPRSSEEVLRYFGFSDRDWYVLLHVRESSTYGPNDGLHDYRNGSIEAMTHTIEAITRAGGAVIRVGDGSMQPISDRMGVLDHARRSSKLPDDDLFLYRFARLFIGNTSGPVALAGIEGIPIVALNAAPMGAALVYDHKAVCVPKIYVRANTGEEIPFAEVFASHLADIRSTSVFDSVGVRLVETSSEVALGAVQEALGWGEYAIETEWDRQAQIQFRNLYREGNYSRYSSSRIARVFLRRYAHLL